MASARDEGPRRRVTGIHAARDRRLRAEPTPPRVPAGPACVRRSGCEGPRCRPGSCRAPERAGEQRRTRRGGSGRNPDGVDRGPACFVPTARHFCGDMADAPAATARGQAGTACRFHAPHVPVQRGSRQIADAHRRPRHGVGVGPLGLFIVPGRCPEKRERPGARHTRDRIRPPAAGLPHGQAGPDRKARLRTRRCALALGAVRRGKRCMQTFGRAKRGCSRAARSFAERIMRRHCLSGTAPWPKEWRHRANCPARATRCDLRSTQTRPRWPRQPPRPCRPGWSGVCRSCLDPAPTARTGGQQRHCCGRRS